MIVKKPYAFLIKYFKLIHLFLFVLLVYVAYKTTNILTFFNNYINEDIYTYVENLSSTYINIFIFFLVIIIIIIGLTIYLLMKWKDKKRIYYILLCIFYLVIFVMYIVYFDALRTIETEILDVRTIRAYRDIALIITVPQYLFVIVSLIRGVGFNIKQFNFSKDLDELDISEKDAEEIEIVLSDNTYKYKRKFKRTLREFKYYFLENRFMFLIISLVTIVIVGFIVYLNINVFSKTYKEGNTFNVSGVVFSVNNSYVTDIDFQGNKILKDKIYVVTTLDIKNTSDSKKKLSLDKLRLLVDGNEYLPTLSKNNYFIDYGEGYYNQQLYPGEDYKYLLVFELNDELIDEKFILRMVDSVDYLRGEINAKYKEVLLNPTKHIGLMKSEEYDIDQAISFGSSTLANNELIITKYFMAQSFVEEYSYCISTCYTAKNTIKPSLVDTKKNTLIKIITNYYGNPDLYSYKIINDSQSFISKFACIEYVIDGEKNTSSINVITSKNKESNDVYFEVPYEINNASDIYLVLTVRSVRYIVKLK